MLVLPLAFILTVAGQTSVEAQPHPSEDGDQAQNVSFTSDPSDRMTVGVTIDGSGPFPFVIDTGAERTVVSRELAGRLALKSAGPGRLHGVVRAAPVNMVHVETLAMGDHHSTNLRAPIIDSRDLGGAGLIGIDSLQRRRVTLDFRADEITIQPSMGKQESQFDNEVVVSGSKRKGRLVLMDATLDGKSVAVILDTGSQVTLGNEALRRKLFAREGKRPSKPIIVRDVTGGAIPAIYTTTHMFRIDEMRIKNMPIALADAQVFNEIGFGDRPALLLGMDVLRMFDKVSIDFMKRTAYFVMPKTSARLEPVRLASLDNAMLR